MITRGSLSSSEELSGEGARFRAAVVGLGCNVGGDRAALSDLRYDHEVARGQLSDNGGVIEVVGSEKVPPGAGRSVAQAEVQVASGAADALPDQRAAEVERERACAVPVMVTRLEALVQVPWMNPLAEIGSVRVLRPHFFVTVLSQ
jgi:hypothetical protein